MAQINLRNPKAVALVERLAVRTGKGKTAVLLAALEAYEADEAGTDVDEVLANLEHDVHARIRPVHRGRQPSREELALELGMP
jgi:hypothetical protein